MFFGISLVTVLSEPFVGEKFRYLANAYQSRTDIKESIENEIPNKGVYVMFLMGLFSMFSMSHYERKVFDIEQMLSNI